MFKEGYNPQPFNDKKIVGIIAVLVLLGLVLVLMTNLTSTVLSGARAFVDGESIWSKSQKEASLNLVRYLQEEEPQYYEQFLETVDVTEGYRMANAELAKEDPDLEKIREGFSKRRNNMEDINSAVWMYQNLSWTPSLQQADKQWKQGEQLLQDLVGLGNEIHQKMQTGNLPAAEKQRYMERIYRLDSRLTTAENAFSQTITQSTIYLNTIVYWSTLCIGLILLLSGGFVSIRFIRNVKQWGDSISASEQKFRDVLENTHDVIYRLNREQKEYVYMSPSVKKMLGYSAEQVLNGGPEFIFTRIHPEDLEKLEREVDEMKNNRSMQDYSDETEFRIKQKSGAYIWVSNRRSVIFNDEGNATDIVGTVRNISKHKEYEKAIDQSLEEKKILLQEIHHRVKNNLAVISGLMYLQKQEVKGDARAVLEKTQSRINSVAMIHEKLYGSNSLSDINLAEYIDELTAAIARAYASNEKNIILKKELEPVRIEIEEAVTFGLAINELVNNAYKHAFCSQENGIVRITLKACDNKRILTVADNGEGLPGDFNFDSKSSLGMTLIKSLSKQLGAIIDIRNGTGTEFRITF